MAAEEDESEGEDDLPLEMVDDAGRSNKVRMSFLPPVLSHPRETITCFFDNGLLQVVQGASSV